MSRYDLEPPIIWNAYDSFLYKVSLNNPDAIPPRENDIMMTAFYAGFAHGCGITTAVHEQLSKQERQHIDKLIKRELAGFSAASREFAAKRGTKAVNTGKPLRETHPEIFRGK